MRWEHFKTFVWLRWRLRTNQLRRAGKASVILLALVVAGSVALAVASFIGLFIVGASQLGDADPTTHMYVWDGIVVAYLFFWMVGLLSELQRSEVVSLDKLLHLPVPLGSAYLLNYISSLVTLSTIIFVPATLGLVAGLVADRGPAMIALLLPIAAFFLMITAVTYQFRGWLASMMTNPRRRRTVIVVVSTLFILISQLPQLFNLGVQRGLRDQNSSSQAMTEELNRLNAALKAKEISPQEFAARRAAIQAEFLAKTMAANQELADQYGSVVTYFNVGLPPGWLPLAAAFVVSGQFAAALLATTGMTLLGLGSLWRGYRTTLRLYTGHFTSGKKTVKPVAAPPRATGPLLVEKQLPWLSERTAAIATASFRGLVRAPEAKMMLLSPIVMVAVFGTMFITRNRDIDPIQRPLIAYGAMSMILVSMVQILANQFGFDRAGFKVYVLSAVPRRDILMGKNLSVAPLALGLGLLVTAAMQIVYPFHIGYLLSIPPTYVTMYLLFCTLTNWASMIAPMPIAAGSLRPGGPKLIPFLVNFALLLLLPLFLAPTLLPLAAGTFLEWQGWGSGPLYCLVFSVIECALVILLYRVIMTAQGRQLHARELKVLEVVSSKAE